MTDIDEIALETVKAIGNIDPDKLPGGKTQAVAQAQILVRGAIEKQLEQAQERIADLEEVASKARQDLLVRAEPDWDGSGQMVVNISAGIWDELNRVLGVTTNRRNGHED